MSELSSEASALIGEGRGLLRPTNQDRARVATALARRLGSSVLLAVSPGQAATRPMATVSKLSSFVFVAGVAAASAAYSLTRPPEPPQPPVATVVPASVAPTTPQPAEAPCIAPEAPDAATVTAATPPRKVTPSSGLTEEVSLLSRATGQLQRGDAVGALEALEQHRKRFPAGRLVEERIAARIQALCLLGALGEAEAELSRLAVAAPRSPHLARAKRACGR